MKFKKFFQCVIFLTLRNSHLSILHILIKSIEVQLSHELIEDEPFLSKCREVPSFLCEDSTDCFPNTKLNEDKPELPQNHNEQPVLQQTPKQSSKEPSDKKASKARWGRNEDIQFVKQLQILQEQGELDLKEVLNNAKGHRIKNKALKDLCKRLGWKNTVFKLLQRIQNMDGSMFSAREQKKLKTIVRKAKYNITNPALIHHEFPGKSLENIQKACDIISQCRWKRNLNKVDVNLYLNNS